MSKAVVLLGDLGSDHQGFPPTPVLAGSPDVLIDGKPVARVGDPLAPHSKPKHPLHPRAIAAGSGTVLINGMPAAVTGGAITCGGVTIGSGSVVIGDTHTPAAFSGISPMVAAQTRVSVENIGNHVIGAQAGGGITSSVASRFGSPQFREGGGLDGSANGGGGSQTGRSSDEKKLDEKALRIGVFFDGTGNHKENDKQLSDRDITNIAKLYELYESGKESQSIYIAGPGTVSGNMTQDGFEATEDMFGLALGVGVHGGHKRIQEAISELRDVLNQQKPEKITLDVFGFSRGASLARHFVNLVNRWPSSIVLPEIQMPSFGAPVFRYSNTRAFPAAIEARVGFVGLFDTVGSFYIPGNENNLDFNLDLSPDSADRVVHLTAHHEIRRNFPLSSIRGATGLPPNYTELALPGVHSDIGGGYANPIGAIQNHETFTVHVYTGHGGNHRTTRIAQQKIAELNQNDSRNIQPRVKGLDVIAEERRPTKNEIAVYALHRMHKLAVSEGVPLLPMDTSVDGYSIPAELQQALQAWQNAGANLADSDEYLAGYIHTSHRVDELPHLPEKSGVRRVFLNRGSMASQQKVAE